VTVTDVSRTLVCTLCGTGIEVFEIDLSATSDEAHEYLDPATYVGGVCGCLQPKQLDGDEPPAWMADAVGRARTAQERATSYRRRTT
jgi:hypothetical protein